MPASSNTKALLPVKYLRSRSPSSETTSLGFFGDIGTGATRHELEQTHVNTNRSEIRRRKRSDLLPPRNHMVAAGEPAA
ncbi:uncharacterized protein G2W53_035625 [Senna tora]|uniref:Uncharacterized protein n=1 Tax=Senna tora TaxID=362788 RepID=A0A834W462_9FABA|nr:uncharacterized protein G2W53_035625 [Senna tora]